MKTNIESKRLLITGASGLIGSYLVDHLAGEGNEIFVTGRSSLPKEEWTRKVKGFFACDLSKLAPIGGILAEVRPEAIYHLAAQSQPSLSFKEPALTIRANVEGTANLLQAIVDSGIKPSIQLAGSSAEYGWPGVTPGPLSEEDRFYPASPYAVSKIAMDYLGEVYRRAYGLPLTTVRPFYVVGPRKDGYALSGFAKQITAIEAGAAPVIKTGNLEAVRDPVDVRDCVRAMSLVMNRGAAGQAYNICTGQGISIGEMLQKMIRMSRKKIRLETDPARLRPADEPMIVGDCQKIKRLGWKPQFTLEETLQDILDYWRGKKLEEEEQP